MSLQNLLAIGRLQAHQPDAAGIAKLLQAARRNMADAHVHRSAPTTGSMRPDIIVLDALRRQRNVSDYEGDPVSTATLQGCVDQATKLLAGAENWLRAHRPDLLTPP